MMCAQSVRIMVKPVDIRWGVDKLTALAQLVNHQVLVMG